MEFITILLIAFGLSADCFAVAIGGGVSKKDLSLLQVSRVGLSFGTFQAVMPILGWAAGLAFVRIIENYDHWVALALLGFVGGKMIWESFHSEEGEEKNADITRGWMLFTLSLATSIDALAVGLTFAFVKVNILMASVTIGLTAFTITMIGFWLGRKAHHLIGKRAEMVGGLVLIGIGIKIVLEHTLS